MRHELMHAFHDSLLDDYGKKTKLFSDGGYSGMQGHANMGGGLQFAVGALNDSQARKELEILQN